MWKWNFSNHWLWLFTWHLHFRNVFIYFRIERKTEFELLKSTGGAISTQKMTLVALTRVTCRKMMRAQYGCCKLVVMVTGMDHEGRRGRKRRGRSRNWLRWKENRWHLVTLTSHSHRHNADITIMWLLLTLTFFVSELAIHHMIIN